MLDTTQTHCHCCRSSCSSKARSSCSSRQDPKAALRRSPCRASTCHPLHPPRRPHPLHRRLPRHSAATSALAAVPAKSAASSDAAESLGASALSSSLIVHHCYCHRHPPRCGGGNVSFCCTSGSGKASSIIIINRFYIALFSALEQTHCARM